MLLAMRSPPEPGVPAHRRLQFLQCFSTAILAHERCARRRRLCATPCAKAVPNAPVIQRRRRPASNADGSWHLLQLVASHPAWSPRGSLLRTSRRRDQNETSTPAARISECLPYGKERLERCPGLHNQPLHSGRQLGNVFSRVSPAGSYARIAVASQLMVAGRRLRVGVQAFATAAFGGCPSVAEC